MANSRNGCRNHDLHRMYRYLLNHGRQFRIYRQILNPTFQLIHTKNYAHRHVHSHLPKCHHFTRKHQVNNFCHLWIFWAIIKNICHLSLACSKIFKKLKLVCLIILQLTDWQISLWNVYYSALKIIKYFGIIAKVMRICACVYGMYTYKLLVNGSSWVLKRI